MNKAEMLNVEGAVPEIDRGRIVGLTFYSEGVGREPRLEELRALGLRSVDDFGCLRSHPDGADVGGYVPTLDCGVYLSNDDGVWRDVPDWAHEVPLEQRVERMRKLLSAVRSNERGVWCDDVDGVNWFDVRDEVCSE